MVTAPVSIQAASTFGVTTPTDVASLIAGAQASKQWPIAVHTERSWTANHGAVPGRALVGTYQGGSSKVLAQHGSRHTATTPEQWASLLYCAEQAGAKPFFAGATKGGGRVVACFDVGDPGAAIRSTLVLADSYDGTLKLTGGFCAQRNRCCNMIASLQRGRDFVGIGHTRSLKYEIETLKAAIRAALAGGEKIAELYRRAEETRLTRALETSMLDALTPVPEERGRAQTIALNEREELRAAMALPCNDAGDTIASLWNAYTHNVDREADGSARKVKGSAAGAGLDSMLFGTRGAHIGEIFRTVVRMIDGSEQEVPVVEAVAMGVPVAQALSIGSIFDLDVSPEDNGPDTARN